ncbi:MAG: ABC transporter substrate binding protein, partial [Spirochaetales bacterium]|nr:ABC transporter substrate binding protein [Spirochaetales bacterium]
GEFAIIPESTKGKVLFVDSYHWEYQWSRRIREGLFEAFSMDFDENGLPLPGSGEVQLRIVQLDTKRNTSENFKVDAGKKARDIINEWKPDLVICSDDNAAKYLIQPYLIHSEIPVLYCGINHDASEYGLPADNVAGMVEIHNARGLVGMLEEYAAGDRIAFLSGDNVSGRKIGQSIGAQLETEVREVYVKSYRDWKAQFRILQKEADILLVETAEYFSDWDENRKSLEWFVSQITEIPTGAWDDSLKTVALITLERMGEEQGEWAGRTALKILEGEAAISDIGQVESKRAAVYLNMKLARELDVFFPSDLIDMAYLTNEMNEMHKVLYVNSYHLGYLWSDEVEKGIIKALSRSGLPIDLKILRMDTKRNTSREHGEAQALVVKEFIEEWSPEVVIGSDDDFVRYVLVPYFNGSGLPFVFCGVNSDAEPYGLDRSHITGMVEVNPVRETADILARLADGDRIGFLVTDLYYDHRAVEYAARTLGRDFDLVLAVHDMEGWQAAYLRMQDEVDMLFMASPSGLVDFDEEKLMDFIYSSSRIPSSNMVDAEIPYALLAVSKVAEEQGWWAGNRALDILQGTSPAEIPFTKNVQTKILLNMDLADEMDILFPPDLVQSAVLYRREER